MRTEDARGMRSALSKVRAEATRVRGWFAGLAIALRASLVIVICVLLGTVVYYYAPVETDATLWLDDGRVFSSDARREIQKALVAESLPYKVAPDGRIGVPGDRHVEALAALAKHEIGAVTLDEIDRQAYESSFWDGSVEREQRQKRAIEQKLRSMIERIDGILSANVTINQEVDRSGFRRAKSAGVLVWLETEGDRAVGDGVVQRIRLLVSQFVPGSRAEMIGVFDRLGRPYLVAGEPSTQPAALKKEVREEDLTEKIRARLRSIRGADATVRLDRTQLPPSPPPVIAQRPDEPPSPPPVETIVNRPLEIEPEPTEGANQTPPPAVEAKPVWVEKVNVWVWVPRSHYHRSYREIHADRSPSLDDPELRKLQVRTEEFVRKAVRAAVPAGDLGEITIETTPDEIDLPRAGTSPRDGPNWNLPPWGAAAVGVGSATVLLAAWSAARGVFAGRRSSRKSSRTALRDGLSVDPPTTATVPSERVREFVKSNPEAAAGVLQRWIGQDGGAS